MSIKYDKYYQTIELFGAPYPELIGYFESKKIRGKLIDIGCGQGRNSIPLAKMGYKVKGIDISNLGITQMLDKAGKEKLLIEGEVIDIYNYGNWDEYDYLLLDSMFHFGKNEKYKESELLMSIIEGMKSNAELIICIQKTGKKVETLNRIISNLAQSKRLIEIDLEYQFIDRKSKYRSITPYKMIVEKKK